MSKASLGIWIEKARAALEESADLMEEMASVSSPWVAETAAIIARSLARGGKLLTCGNGGSAADAQHIAAELAVRFKQERKALPAIALTTNPSILTAVSNDLGYDQVFARQIEALGSKGDVLLALSTSGASPNVRVAVERAKQIGMQTIGFTGKKGKDMVELCDRCVVVPSTVTARIQEAHIVVGHAICELVELWSMAELELAENFTTRGEPNFTLPQKETG